MQSIQYADTRLARVYVHRRGRQPQDYKRQIFCLETYTQYITKLIFVCAMTDRRENLNFRVDLESLSNSILGHTQFNNVGPRDAAQLLSVASPGLRSFTTGITECLIERAVQINRSTQISLEFKNCSRESTPMIPKQRRLTDIGDRSS